jgi:hypothetical protein
MSYILCGAGGGIQLNLSSIRLDSIPFTHCPSILFIALPVGPGKSLTSLSVNAAPDEGHRPVSGARPPGKVLRRGPGLSSPEVLLEGPQDAPRSLPGSVHHPGSLLCVARGRKRSSPCLSGVTGGELGGAPHRPSPDDATSKNTPPL